MLRGLQNYKHELRDHLQNETQIAGHVRKRVWGELARPIITTALDTRFAQKNR
jgi:hypothetical protein